MNNFFKEKYEFPAGALQSPQKNGVEIMHDYWIGALVSINCGIKLNNGAVICARSHVVKDVPPYEVVGGNPTKIIKYRFPPEIISALQKSEWLNADPNILGQCNQSTPYSFLEDFSFMDK